MNGIGVTAANMKKMRTANPTKSRTPVQETNRPTPPEDHPIEVTVNMGKREIVVEIVIGLIGRRGSEVEIERENRTVVEDVQDRLASKPMGRSDR